MKQFCKQGIFSSLWNFVFTHHFLLNRLTMSIFSAALAGWTVDDKLASFSIYSAMNNCISPLGQECSFLSQTLHISLISILYKQNSHFLMSGKRGIMLSLVAVLFLLFCSDHCWMIGSHITLIHHSSQMFCFISIFINNLLACIIFSETWIMKLCNSIFFKHFQQSVSKTSFSIRF